MSRIGFKRRRVRLKQLFGIRARLALLAVLLVAPLMVERIRSLEDARERQIAQAIAEFSLAARNSATAQREVISAVETLLKSEAYMYAFVSGPARSCDVLDASLPSNLPWIRTLLIASGDGRIQCSTTNTYVGLDLSDRPYFRQARESGRFVLSSFLLARPSQTPVVMAAYPVAALGADSDAVVLATVNLDWMSKIMDALGGRPGISNVLIDANGTVLAAAADQSSMIGKPLDNLPLLSSIADMALHSDREEGSLSFKAPDGSNRRSSFLRVTGTGALLVANIDEDRVSAAVSRNIRTAYVQLGFVCLFVLLGALLAAEKLVIQPIEVLAGAARRFGQGDWSARARRNRLPAEFLQLARAFNAMAGKLSQRERQLIESNDRLTVMASIDELSGLANRRGFQSRLDFEWMKAMHHGAELALLMIDVDHFKLYNDTYGHPEGDTCLRRLGEALSAIATQTAGFAARYGGEEFCLLVPNVDLARAMEIAEMIRTAIERLALPHTASCHGIVTVSIGVAALRPTDQLSAAELIESADAALYAAKHRGRNNVAGHGLVLLGNGAEMAMAG